MLRLRRAAIAALAGALSAAASLVLLYGRHPGLVLDMDRDVPQVTRGIYASERSGDLTFAWTSRRADIHLAGLDRRVDWLCSVTFRGARSPELPQPELAVAIDGITAATVRGTNDFQTVEVAAPGRPFVSGLTVSLVSSMTFVPGPSDRRQLGVQVDRMACRPAGASRVLPPERALWSAALAAATFGAAFGLAGLTAGASALAAGALALAQAIALSIGAAPYADYPGTLIRLAVWIAPLVVVTGWLGRLAGRRPLHRAASFVVAFSAVALYLKLAALLHPSKPLIDALFHAHRLDWVLGGRFYFTQLSTSSTPFPYAIGLYAFAAPWSLLTSDHVTLLRVVVCACEVVAGAMLYPMIVRAWGDRLAGATAVALFSLVPVSYIVVGNANLTNSFGQSISVAAVALATIWAPGARHPVQWLVLTSVVTLGFVSHVSTVVLLMPTLVVLAALYRWRGGPDLRAHARGLLVATLAAGMLSLALYWGHFGEVYSAQLARMRATPAADVRGEPAGQPLRDSATTREPGGPVLGRDTIPLGGRAMSALAQTLSNVGWPILVLAVAGLWRVAAEGRRDRLVFALMAWGAVCLLFVTFSVISATDRRYQQDAWEFIGRVEHATYPAAVVLAALGAAWAWRGGIALRFASGALLLGAVLTGARAWASWIS